MNTDFRPNYVYHFSISPFIFGAFILLGGKRVEHVDFASHSEVKVQILPHGNRHHTNRIKVGMRLTELNTHRSRAVAGIESTCGLGAIPTLDLRGFLLYHAHANTAGLHASAAMGLSGRLEFDSSNHGGLC
jgi:hypothetical protein